jgi:hypothetical protein
MALVHSRAFDPRFIDESPWYWPVRDVFEALSPERAFPSADALSEVYARGRPAEAPALRFVDAPKIKPRRRPPGAIALASLYEGRIAELGEVPQRPDDWHDLFNALAFLAFPRAKAALHLRQYAISKQRIAPGATRLPGARTREQDALALFDEGGVAVLAGPADAARIDVQADDCGRLVASLCAEGRAHVVPFGHALYEHLVAGLPCPLAMPHVIPSTHAWDPTVRAHIDTELARALTDPSAFVEPARSKGLSLAALPCVPPE